MSTPRKFVILSDARSGTSLLSETLNSHPAIVCHGEIFHPTPTYHIKISQEEMAPEDLLSLRESDTQKFVDLVFDRPDAETVGFKMWRSQNAEYCNVLLNDETVAKIIYERRNILAKFSSIRLARETGVWNIKSGASRPKVLDKKLSFESQQFSDHANRHRGLFDYYRKNSKGRVFNTSYLDIVEHGFSEVLEFLEVPNVPLTPQKERLHSSSILERFQESDHDSVIRVVEELGHPEWLQE